MLRSNDIRTTLNLGLALVFSGSVGLCPAQFTLEEPDAAAFRQDRGRSATLRYEPRLSYRVEDTTPMDLSVLTSDVPTGELDPDKDWRTFGPDDSYDEPEQMPMTSGVLLALPGRALDWTVEVTPAEAANAITITDVVVGTVPALHVVIDRAMAGEEGDMVEIRLEVESASDGDLPRRSVAADPTSARLAHTLFLNGEELNSIPLATSSGTRSRELVEIPPAPGDKRITFKEGRGLIAVPLTQLGVGVGEASVLRLDYHGERIPVVTSFAGNALIYAPRRDTLHDDNDSIFATADGSDPSLPVAMRPAFDTLTPDAGEVAQERSRTFRQITRYERASTLPVGDRFVMHRAQRPGSAAFPTTAVRQLPVYDHLTSEDVFVQIRVLGLNSDPANNPDHFADFTLDGVAIPRIEWNGRTQAQRLQTVTLTSLPNPPSLELTHFVPQAAASSDIQNLRDVTLAWTGYPRIDSAGRGTVTVPANLDDEDNHEPRLVTLGGFPAGTTASTLVVLDITEPLAPVRLTAPFTFSDVSGTVAVQFEAPGTPGTYFAQRIDFGESPIEVVDAETLPETTESGVTLKAVYVRDPAYADTLQPLVDARGAGVIEFDPQAAYNAFSGGQKDPEAIRLAVKTLLEAAPQRRMMPDLVLVGDSTFDPRNYLGFIQTPQIPVYIENSFADGGIPIENSVDYFYGLLFGDDVFEDVQIGRLPVKNSDELGVMVNRFLAHRAIEEQLGAMDRVGYFIGGLPRPNEFFDFRADSVALASIFDQGGNSSMVQELTGTRQPAFTDFQTALAESEAGFALINYMGHGNNDRWADEQFIRNSDIPNLDTEGNWPLVATFTCLNSYYAFPENPRRGALGAVWVTTPNRGAIATITPTSVETYFPQLEFAIRFVGELRLAVGFRPNTVGEVFTISRTKYLTALPGLGRTARTYLLFGDPSSNLTLPAGVDHDFMWFY